MFSCLLEQKVKKPLFPEGKDRQLLWQLYLRRESRNSEVLLLLCRMTTYADKHLTPITSPCGEMCVGTQHMMLWK